MLIRHAKEHNGSLKFNKDENKNEIRIIDNKDINETI